MNYNFGEPLAQRPVAAPTARPMTGYGAFAEDSRAHDLAVLQSERAIEREKVVLLEGRIHTLHMIKFPVRDADGKVSGLGTIATGVIERKRAEARRTIGLCQGGGKRAQ